MPTPAERKALLFLAALVSLGTGVRVMRAVSRDPAADPASSAALREQLRRVDSARVSGKGGRPRRASKKASASTKKIRVDMDTASEALIETLNGVGPALAERIVAHRDSFGAFGSLDGLMAVRGIGPALAAKLGPQVTFSRLPRPQNAVIDPPPRRRKTPKKAQAGRAFP